MIAEISVLKLTCWVHLGLDEHERKRLQPVEVSVKLKVDIDAATKSDDHKDTINTYHIQQTIKEAVEEEMILMERMAQNIYDLLVEEFAPLELEVYFVKTRALTEVGSSGTAIRISSLMQN